MNLLRPLLDARRHRLEASYRKWGAGISAAGDPGHDDRQWLQAGRNSAVVHDAMFRRIGNRVTRVNEDFNRWAAVDARILVQVGLSRGRIVEDT